MRDASYSCMCPYWEERPYKCEVCTREFVESGSLKKHSWVQPKRGHTSGSFVTKNSFSEQIVHKLRNKLTTKKEQPLQMQPMQQHNKKWVTFTYHGPSVRKVTNLFKRTNF